MEELCEGQRGKDISSAGFEDWIEYEDACLVRAEWQIEREAEKGIGGEGENFWNGGAFVSAAFFPSSFRSLSAFEPPSGGGRTMKVAAENVQSETSPPQPSSSPPARSHKTSQPHPQPLVGVLSLSVSCSTKQEAPPARLLVSALLANERGADAALMASPNLIIRSTQVVPSIPNSDTRSRSVASPDACGCPSSEFPL